MKSAYELAMERLKKQRPEAKLTEEQRKELAELDSIYAAKVAEQEIHLNGKVSAAENAGDWEAAEQARQQLAAERKKLAADLEEKKERVRSGK